MSRQGAWRPTAVRWTRSGALFETGMYKKSSVGKRFARSNTGPADREAKWWAARCGRETTHRGWMAEAAFLTHPVWINLVPGNLVQLIGARAATFRLAWLYLINVWGRVIIFLIIHYGCSFVFDMGVVDALVARVRSGAGILWAADWSVV